MSALAAAIGWGVLAALAWFALEIAWWAFVCALAARDAFGRWNLRETWSFLRDYIPDEIQWPNSKPRRRWNGEAWKRAARRHWWHPYRWRRLRKAIVALIKQAATPNGGTQG